MTARNRKQGLVEDGVEAQKKAEALVQEYSMCNEYIDSWLQL